MFVKNKLYKHHKSKAAMLTRNFSIAVSSLFALVAIVAIPTYISSNNVAETKAVNTTEKVEVGSEEQNDNNVEVLNLNLD